MTFGDRDGPCQLGRRCSSSEALARRDSERQMQMLQKLKPIHLHCANVAKFAWGAALSGGGSRVRRHALVLLYKSFEWLAVSYRIAWLARRNPDAVGAASVRCE